MGLNRFEMSHHKLHNVNFVIIMMSALIKHNKYILIITHSYKTLILCTDISGVQ